MKSFSKLFAGLAMAGLLLAGCAPATEIKEDAKPVVISAIDLPLALGTATSVPGNITLEAGENNLNATYAGLSLTTDEAANTNQVIYDYAAGTKKWADEVGGALRVPEDKGLQFSIKAVGPATESGKTAGQNAYTILKVKKLNYVGMADKTGITFSIKVGGAINSIGVKVFVRALGTAGDVNANAWTAALNSVPSTDWDWVYFGDHQFINFKVPFSKFSKAGGATQTQASIAAALADSVVFDQLELAFRMDTADNGTLNTAYPAVIDNVKLY